MDKSRRPTPGERLRKAYVSLLFSLLVLGGITFVLKACHDVHYPFAWDDDDGAVWWETVHVTDLSALYHPIRDYPYFVVPYPPVFHAVAWLATRVTGSFLVGGRLVCIGAALGIGLISGLLVFYASPRRIPARNRMEGAVLAALLCCRLDSLSDYMPGVGVDPLAVFLTFLGVWLFIRFLPKERWNYAAFTVFVLAVFTKQTMVAAPAACLLTCTLVNRRRAARLLLFSLALGAAILGCLSWATGGEVVRHLFLYNAEQPFSITHLILGLQENAVKMLPLIALAGLAFLPFLHHGLWGKRGAFVRWLRAGVQASPYRRTLLVLGLELVIALLVSQAYGKAGGGFHYFLEWNLACCPLAGLLFVRVMDRWRPSSRYTLGGAAVSVLLLLCALTGFPDSLYRIDSVYRFTRGVSQIQDAQYSSAAAALKIIEQTPGPVFCENMVLTMKAHKEIPIEPGIQCYLAKAGIWDQSGFVKMIATHQFGVLIMRGSGEGFCTDEIAQAIEQNYLRREEIGDPTVPNAQYTVFRPRSGPGER